MFSKRYPLYTAIAHDFEKKIKDTDHTTKGESSRKVTEQSEFNSRPTTQDGLGSTPVQNKLLELQSENFEQSSNSEVTIGKHKTPDMSSQINKEGGQSSSINTDLGL